MYKFEHSSFAVVRSWLHSLLMSSSNIS